MAKVLVYDEKAQLIENSEDLFKLSNKLEDWIDIRPSNEVKELISQTFYTYIDKNVDPELHKIFIDLYPTSIFRSCDKEWKVSACGHLTNNVIHCSNFFILHHQIAFQTYLPANWKISFDKSIDYPVGDFILFNLFDRLTDFTVKSFLASNFKYKDQVPLCTMDDKTKENVLIDILKFVCAQPDLDFADSFSYQVNRRLTGNVVRDTAFEIFSKERIRLIGPELESIRNVTLHFFKNRDSSGMFEFNTITSKQNRTYKQNTDWQKTTKLTFSHLIAPIRKNQNNFFKGLFHHCNKFGWPNNIVYVGAYPSLWLEDIPWFPSQIECYDPKERLINLRFVKWHAKFFSFIDTIEYGENTYYYIDIRSDIRGSDESMYLGEDLNIRMITDYALKNAKTTVFAKRKVFEKNRNISYNEPLFPPDSIHFGKEYYNLVNANYTEIELTSDELFAGINSAITENKSHYVYNGTKAVSSSDLATIALYSLSNHINSLQHIRSILTSPKIITTFPTQQFVNWRLLENDGTSFNGKIKQNKFIDWTISPKAFVTEFMMEVVSEEVFVSILNGRICIPTPYNHLVAFKFKWGNFFSDRYFSHIGMRQPSIARRDIFKTSRLNAYINRRLTHSSDLSTIRANNFAGYSGHLITVETYFNSLVYTMSPLRWMLRSYAQFRHKETSKFRIGKNDPHSVEEYKNTYQFLENENIDPLHKKITGISD